MLSFLSQFLVKSPGIFLICHRIKNNSFLGAMGIGKDKNKGFDLLIEALNYFFQTNRRS